MDIPRDPTSAEIAYFLSTRSGDQMVQLMQSIREPAAQVTLTASLLLAPPVSGQIAAPEKTRKALNAFVGFRCYYILIPVFKPWPMKKLSNLMGVIWEADPNKSFWSLMTKAWSMIRDQIGKDKAPLDQFFRIICPYLNMPSPETYLERHGWQLVIDKEGAPTISRENIPQPGSLGAGIADMALSVEDIINYCQSMGYAQAYVSATNNTSPMFLGHSINHAAGKSSSITMSTQVAGSVHDSRMAARNKRRAKRQNIRETGVVPKLQEQILDAHVTNQADVPQGDGSNIFGNEPGQFYSNLADLLTNHIIHCEDTNTGFPSNTVSGWTDWSAFRLGADEDATLPSFDPSSL
ncbi:MAT1-1-1 [Dothidotthia symphoricarpi CBS 119687]|uniref:Mating-type protein MAT-1 n=1 Tax=Dothidotthia symphoricarpi CBS 119687 TaxID=1392245 RepID=A0A6A6AMF0_9PLEO|nr:MAT1-1-1 [Dothidotthia symphoricarpi CBS 119687]KAF2132265.1 MAT1-1-1 [Dothidotthia symphoricarpi CBS 119687]